MQVGQLGELELVRQIRAILDAPRADLLVGNGDDALVWQPAGQVVATVDSIVGGIDWLRGPTPAEAVGARAAAVNLSDLAAMGAQPAILLLALELPPEHEVAVLLRSIQGLKTLAQRHGALVAGGDLGFSPGPPRWTVTALGTLTGPPMRRDRVQAGDALWLIGPVGMAGLGLELLKRQMAPEEFRATPADRAQPALIVGGSPYSAIPEVFRAPPQNVTQPLVTAHLWPQPLVREGLLLQHAGVQAAIDISDGLGLDAQRLAQASQVDLHLDLPHPAWLTADLEQYLQTHDLDWHRACAQGGDDYALLCAAPPDLDVLSLLPLAVRLGHAQAGTGQVRLRVAGLPQSIAGWQHGR